MLVIIPTLYQGEDLIQL